MAPLAPLATPMVVAAISQHVQTGFIEHVGNAPRI